MPVEEENNVSNISGINSIEGKFMLNKIIDIFRESKPKVIEITCGKPKIIEVIVKKFLHLEIEMRII